MKCLIDEFNVPCLCSSAVFMLKYIIYFEMPYLFWAGVDTDEIEIQSRCTHATRI